MLYTICTSTPTLFVLREALSLSRNMKFFQLHKISYLRMVQYHENGIPIQQGIWHHWVQKGSDLILKLHKRRFFYHFYFVGWRIQARGRLFKQLSCAFELLKSETTIILTIKFLHCNACLQMISYSTPAIRPQRKSERLL